MANDRAVPLAAACTAALGVVSIVTGSPGVAVVTGLAAVVSAAVIVMGASPAGESPAGESPVDHGSQEPLPPAAETPEPTTAYRSVGMLDEQMLEATLRGRIAVARRALRPLSLIHVEIIDADEPAAGGERPSEFIASVLGGTLREADACGLRRDGVYVFILEETGEDGAVWTAERLRRKLALTSGERRFCAGIASYPSHGLDAEVLEAKAHAALVAAREWRRDRIEVAAGL